MWYIEQATPYGYPKLPESVSFISHDGITVEYVPRRVCKVVSEEYDDLLEYWSTEFSCGHYGNGMAAYFGYCPKCGAEVLS